MLDKIKNEYELYNNYPDTLTVKQMREMLGNISKYAALKLIYDGKVKAVKIARVFRISKNSDIEYIIKNNIQCK